MSGDHVFAHAQADGETVYEAVDTLRQHMCMQLARLHSRTHRWASRLV